MKPADKAVMEMAAALAKHGWRAQIDRLPHGKPAVFVHRYGVWAVAYEAEDRWRVAYQEKAGKHRWTTAKIVADAAGAIRAIEDGLAESLTHP